ncbi:MAG: hypothetical protein MJ211_01225 [Bacteroidales bacterium]|nr:hypothetical protein [Bacteroidales bacterium]
MKQNLVAILLIILTLVVSCGGKYDHLEITEDEFDAYISVYKDFHINNKDFLLTIKDKSEFDSLKIKNSHKIKQILYDAGFEDPDFFVSINNKISPILETIGENSEFECFPGLGSADLSFLDQAEEQYSKFLTDSSLSSRKKENYEANIQQIQSTKRDLLDKQAKNEAWIKFIRSECRACKELSDNQIMQLTILERELSEI